MINIYQLETGELLVSKEYVDDKFKQIRDALISHINSYPGHDITENKTTSIGSPTQFHVEKIKREDSSQVKEITSDMVKTNAQQGFISQQELMSLKNRPTSLEVAQQIKFAREDLTKYINDKFDVLLNMQNVVEKVKTFINIVKEDDQISGILEEVSSKITRDEFTDHLASPMHVADNDRKALNVLVKLCTEGFADWTADKKSMNFIRNKPESLPANGGNADTVGGHTAEELMNKQFEDIIIGVSGNGYNDETVNFCIKKDYSNIDDIKKAITDRTCGTIKLRTGIYILGELNLASGRSTKSNDLIIGGSGSNSIIADTEVTLNNNVTIHDIYFKSCNIHFGSNSELINCQFDDCTFYFEGCDCSALNLCKFKDCIITFKGNCTNCIITNNKFIHSNTLKYLGKTNAIANNINII